MSTLKAKNRFKGVNWNPDASTEEKQPVIDNDMLAISLANHVITQFGRAETINAFSPGRNKGGRITNKPDQRKAFADVLVTSPKKAAIVVNKTDSEAKQMQKLAGDAGYPIFYNCKNLKEFKEWFSKTF